MGKKLKVVDILDWSVKAQTLWKHNFFSLESHFFFSLVLKNKSFKK